MLDIEPIQDTSHAVMVYFDGSLANITYWESGNFRVFRFSRSGDLGHFTMSRTRELSISMIGNAIIIIVSQDF